MKVEATVFGSMEPLNMFGRLGSCGPNCHNISASDCVPKPTKICIVKEAFAFELKRTTIG